LAQSVKRSGKVSSFHGELARIWRWWSLITSHLQLCSVCWGAGDSRSVTIPILHFQEFQRGIRRTNGSVLSSSVHPQESSANENHVSVTCFIFNYGRIVLVFIFRWTRLKFGKIVEIKTMIQLIFNYLEPF
jgi:hypothetical protein